MSRFRAEQPLLFDPGFDAPEGFLFAQDFINPDEETRLLDWIGGLDFAPYRHRGFDARRQVAWFGLRYDPDEAALQNLGAIPEVLHPLRDRAAAFAGLAGDEIVHVLINRYEPGAPIGWHRDRPQFGVVVGVSLASDCLFRFRLREEDGRFRRVSVPLPRRSIYALTGAARQRWEHSIGPHPRLRYSITLRALAHRQQD
jgi:alkylated DNA repair dioxygenase AlkB